MHGLRQVSYILASMFGATHAADDYCRALVLSGGASNGAWEAGILYGIATAAQNPADFHYDVVTGISAGAINAAGLAPFAPEELMESAQYLSDTWANLHTHDIWKWWDYEGPIEGCIKEQGCVDTSPAIAFLGNLLAQFPDGYKRRMTVAAVDVNTGDFIQFD